MDSASNVDMLTDGEKVTVNKDWLSIVIDENETLNAITEQKESLSKGLDVYARKVQAFSSNLFFYEMEVDKIKKSIWQRILFVFNPSKLTPPPIPEESQFWL